MYRRNRLFFKVAFLFIALSLIAGCTSPGQMSTNRRSVDDSGKGKLSLFLNLKEDRGSDLEMRIGSIESFEPGYYSRLRVTLTGASLVGRMDERIPLVPETAVVEVGIPDHLYIGKGDSRSLFLSWDVQASLVEGMHFKPVFRLARPTCFGLRLFRPKICMP